LLITGLARRQDDVFVQSWQQAAFPVVAEMRVDSDGVETVVLSGLLKAFSDKSLHAIAAAWQHDDEGSIARRSVSGLDARQWSLGWRHAEAACQKQP
jgi:hypothetical protein